MGLTPGISPITLVAKEKGHIRYSDLSLGALQARFLTICDLVGPLGVVEGVDEARSAIASWIEPPSRQLSYEVGGHGTIFPNAAVLRACGFTNVGAEPFARFREGEKAHLDQIVLTTDSIFTEREANPPSLGNSIYPRMPDLNVYCPATRDLKSAISPSEISDQAIQRLAETALRILNKQSSYSYEISSETQFRAVFLKEWTAVQKGEKPFTNPLFSVRQEEIWLGTQAVSCLAVSEIGAVIRLPNRMNLTKGIVRQFAQHYRADQPQILKRAELFRGVQRALADAFPKQIRALLERSRDGIRVIADAHIEWLDVRGIPLGIRYNVSRIPVTPGNLFIDTLSNLPFLYLTPDDFRDILIISGLRDGELIAEQFRIAFDIFGGEWRDTLRIQFVRVASRRELVDAINRFQGVLMVFDGHGSHNSSEPGLLWLGDESVDVWTLREELVRVPPIVILSACDTHAADRNHATVANGFLSLGCRSVLGSVFPLDAFQAAILTARLLRRVSIYIPAAIKGFRRSLTWLEGVSGMLRHQAATDIILQRDLALLNKVELKNFL